MLVAGLARAFVRRGLRVAPFKPQNMSNNAAVTADGGEIGRAQALQARAAGLAPHTDMNPVLLKPETDVGAQVIVQGKRTATLKARDYGKMKSTLMPAVLDSFHRLAAQHDLILIEGAGSPAEINLRAGDIANMGFAEAANVPVILIGDIDRGGVIAQLVGTHVVLPPEDRDRIKAFAVTHWATRVQKRLLRQIGRGIARTGRVIAGQPQTAAPVNLRAAWVARRQRKLYDIWPRLAHPLRQGSGLVDLILRAVAVYPHLVALDGFALRHGVKVLLIRNLRN